MGQGLRLPWSPGETVGPSFAFALLILAQSLVVVAMFVAPQIALPASLLPAAVLLLLLAPPAVGVGIFLYAGAFLPLVGLRQRASLGALLFILVFVLLAEYVRLLRRGRLFPDPTAIDRPLFAFLLVVLLGVFVGVSRGAGPDEWPLEAFPYLCLMLAPLAARHLTLDWIRRLFTMQVVFLLAQSVAAIVFFAQGGFIRLYDPRFSIHPSLAAVVLFAIFVFHSSRRIRILAGLLMLPMVAQLVCTMTRGYWLGFAGGLATVLFLASRRFRGSDRQRVAFRVAGSAALLGVVGLAVLNDRGLLSSLSRLGERLVSLTNLGRDGSTKVRMIEWGLAFREFLGHPLAGTGFGSHLEFYHPLYRFRIPQWWFVHNSYLLLLMKLGLAGLVSFAVLAGAVFRSARAAVQHPVGSLRLCFAAGFAANLVQFLIGAVTNYTFCKAINTTYMAFAVGALVLLAREAGGGEDGARPAAPGTG